MRSINPAEMTVPILTVLVFLCFGFADFGDWSFSGVDAVEYDGQAILVLGAAIEGRKSDGRDVRVFRRRVFGGIVGGYRSFVSLSNKLLSQAYWVNDFPSPEPRPGKELSLCIEAE